MTDKDDNDDHDVELQGVLAKRLLVAGALVGVLLAILAFVDYLATPDETPEAPVFTQPVPVPPKKALSQPVTPVAELPPPPASVEPVATPPALPATPDTPPPAPEVPAKPALPAPSTESPVPLAVPAKPAAPRTESPVAAKPAVTAPAPLAVLPASKPATPVEPPGPRPSPVAVPEGTAAPDAPKPTASVLPKPPEPAKPAPQPPRLFSGYVVQAGVFTSTRAAEELHARLTLNGIPSTLEARVQVGPFKTKEEAEAARQKLKTLGIEGLMLPPAGRR